VSIINESGTPVHSGATPITVTLKKGLGYFKPETYTVRFAKQGYQAREVTVRGEISGWNFGNITFGGLIGLLAVEPATGAMYTLKPSAVGATLDSLKVLRTGEGQSLTVVLLADMHRRNGINLFRSCLIRPLKKQKKARTNASAKRERFSLPHRSSSCDLLYEIAATTH
jgi:hypothetical protein